MCNLFVLHIFVNFIYRQQLWIVTLVHLIEKHLLVGGKTTNNNCLLRGALISTSFHAIAIEAVKIINGMSMQIELFYSLL